jgi:peptide-methionine (R)-S-oxide reductase
VNRRVFLKGLAIVPLGLAATSRALAVSSGRSGADVEALRQDWKDLLAADADVTLTREPLERSEAEWRRTLTPVQFGVLRKEDTERPGSSPLNHEKRPGVYVCAGCSLPLFTSAMKYDSGTGWPSFFTSIPGAVATKKDYLLIIPRTEYHCVRCGGHQGHVFGDGPPPTNQRWCNNGVALRFIPKKAAA